MTNFLNSFLNFLVLHPYIPTITIIAICTIYSVIFIMWLFGLPMYDNIKDYLFDHTTFPKFLGAFLFNIVVLLYVILYIIGLFVNDTLHPFIVSTLIGTAFFSVVLVITLVNSLYNKLSVFREKMKDKRYV